MTRRRNQRRDTSRRHQELNRGGRELREAVGKTRGCMRSQWWRELRRLEGGVM